jgi:hypothetical protein
VTVSNGGTIGTIVHRVIEGAGAGRWFPIMKFINQHGEQPADAAPDALLETAVDSPGFPPPVGTQIRICGVTMASMCLETDFVTLLGSLAP